MDWERAIGWNRKVLLRVLARMFAAIGLVSGGSVATVSRHVRRIVLDLLGPAESATRRLIVIEAQGMVVSPGPARTEPKTMSKGSSERIPTFRLFDPRKRFRFVALRRAPGAGPRFSIPGLFEPDRVETPLPSADDQMNVAHICRRLLALEYALGDLSKQAKRLARYEARRLRQDPKKAGLVRPMRRGRPPGHRARHRYTVDAILAECHALALHALKPPDTS